MIPNNLKKTNEWNSKDILLCIASDPHSSRVWLGSSDFAVYELDLAQQKSERTAFTGEGHES